MPPRPRPRRRSFVLPVACLALVASVLTTSSSQAATSPSITITAVGDTILGNTPQLPSDPAGYLSPIRSTLASGAQVVFGNLEGTLTSSTGSKCGSSSGSTCFAFRNPPAFGKYLAGAGFTALGTANNHSKDFGAAGLRDTLNSIRAAHMSYAGQPGQIDYVKAGTVTVAIVAFAPYSSSNNLLNLSTAANLIAKARANAPVVIVYMHAGAEGSRASHVTGQEEHYLGEDRGNPKAFAHMAIAHGASVVIASGPHVLRGIELYRGHPVVYSLGDFASYHNFSTSGVLSKSMILRLTLSPTGAFRSGRITSVVLGSNGRATLGGDSVSFVNTLSGQDFGAAAPRFSREGVFIPR